MQGGVQLMLQDEGNRMFWDTFKSMLKSVANYIAKSIMDSGKKTVKKTAKTVKEATENHEKKSLKDLTKKHQNTGIHVSKDFEISEENLKKLKTELQKYKIDFAVEKVDGEAKEGKVNCRIFCPSAHREVLGHLIGKHENPVLREGLTSRLERARGEAEAHNSQLKMQKNHNNALGKEPLKHRAPRH